MQGLTGELALGLFGTEGAVTIDEVIAGVPAWAGGDVQAESIEGGLTNANYRLTVTVTSSSACASPARTRPCSRSTGGPST